MRWALAHMIEETGCHAGHADILRELIDGSTVGGPTITFPQAQLAGLFGSTVIVGTTRLTFNTQFTCGTRLPQSIAADIALVERGSAPTVVSAGARLQ